MKTGHEKRNPENLNRRTQRAQRFVGWPPAQFLRLLCYLLFVSAFSVSLLPVSSAFEPVQAEIEKETAWTGEAVPLIIKLFSPGPFSGTASFDLPDLPRTAFVQAGNPVVGSEEVDGESYFTQRHVLTLFTQRDGEIVIPAFRVRFSGKKTFTADPESMEGFTPELRFQSKRPPGTESMGTVVSATEMDVQQTWNPQSPEEIQAGDVIVRTIRRTAVGTTAMMLPAVPTSAPDGIQVYAGTPEVQDKVQRGDSRAERTDTTKYQFQRAGSFTLPEITFVWWDPRQEKLQRRIVPGLTVAVDEASAAASPVSEPKQQPSSVWVFAFVGLLVFGLFVWLIRKPALRLIESWRTDHNRSEALARRALRAACASNDASAAYSALMSWVASRRAEQGWDELAACFESGQDRELRTQWQLLSRHLFASESASATWQGKQLWAAFSRAQRRPIRKSRRNRPPALPELNPSGSSADLAVS